MCNNVINSTTEPGSEKTAGSENPPSKSYVTERAALCKEFDNLVYVFELFEARMKYFTRLEFNAEEEKRIKEEV